MLRTHRGAQTDTAQLCVHAVDDWRRAAELVASRWAAFRAAAADDRAGAFAAYVTALDAEASAANRLAVVRAAAAA
jgi:hypothetical protein